MKSGLELKAGTAFTTLLRYPCLSEAAFTRAKEFIPARWENRGAHFARACPHTVGISNAFRPPKPPISIVAYLRREKKFRLPHVTAEGSRSWTHIVVRGDVTVGQYPKKASLGDVVRTYVPWRRTHPSIHAQRSGGANDAGTRLRGNCWGRRKIISITAATTRRTTKRGPSCSYNLPDGLVPGAPGAGKMCVPSPFRLNVSE